MTLGWAWPKVSRLQRRIELCSGRISSADAVLQTAGGAADGQPTGSRGRSLPKQAQSEKSQGVRGTESPGFFDSGPKRIENYGWDQLRPTGRFEVEDFAVLMPTEPFGDLLDFSCTDPLDVHLG